MIKKLTKKTILKTASLRENCKFPKILEYMIKDDKEAFELFKTEAQRLYKSGELTKCIFNISGGFSGDIISIVVAHGNSKYIRPLFNLDNKKFFKKSSIYKSLESRKKYSLLELAFTHKNNRALDFLFYESWFCEEFKLLPSFKYSDQFNKYMIDKCIFQLGDHHGKATPSAVKSLMQILSSGVVDAKQANEINMRLSFFFLENTVDAHNELDRICFLNLAGIAILKMTDRNEQMSLIKNYIYGFGGDGGSNKQLLPKYFELSLGINRNYVTPSMLLKTMDDLRKEVEKQKIAKEQKIAEKEEMLKKAKETETKKQVAKKEEEAPSGFQSTSNSSEISSSSEKSWKEEKKKKATIKKKYTMK